MKKANYLIFVFFVSQIIFSCSYQNDTFSLENNDGNSDTNFVDIKEAISLATLLEFDISQPESSIRTITALEIENIEPIGSREKPAYYIVNYKNNLGFAIIAADKRVAPLLAFSTENNFNLNSNELPLGLVEWMESADEYIQNVRDSEIGVPVQIRSTVLCNALKTTLRKAPPSNEECFDVSNGCPPEYQSSKTVGPLLKTSWHQRAGFNDLVPKSCDNGKAPAGCLAIAVAQVMYYHQYPTSYDWSSMDINLGGSEAARLIINLNHSNSLNTSYDCSGSEAKFNRIEPTLKNNLYNVSYAKFNSNTVKNQLDSKLPVILIGGTASTWSFLGLHGTGHAWVCDGYISTNTCTYSTLMLHMNWGWGKDYNGWYGVNDWNAPSGTSYNKDNHMAYNIKP